MTKSLSQICILIATILSPQGSSQEPSYDDTLHYIQERMSVGLEEQDHCRLIYHGGQYYEPRFKVGELAPHVSWHGDGVSGSVNCEGGKSCLHEDGRDLDKWEFTVKGDSNHDKMTKAILHLLDLCGSRPAKPDLF